MSEESGYKLSGGLHVSAEDDREYRRLVLPNKLQVLLIHDPEADKGSAAMDVNVGHFCDPEHLPGLAHFCEHMLFLGTEKYPDENSYSKFLNDNGGGSNAWTSMENTNYFFDVTHPFLLGAEGALDRFAQFFTAPLFTATATDREMKAVDAENSKNLQSDVWRLMQLFRSGARATHPLSKYGTGNLQTLQATPAETGVDVRAALLEFHGKYYSANMMRLVVLGREGLDALQAAVEAAGFGAIRNDDVAVPRFDGEPYGEGQLRTEVHAVTIKDSRNIELSFFLPPARAHYRAKPANILSHLVGHEGAGSLLSHLKARGWVNELSAGLWNDNSDFATFAISLEATEAGIEARHEVVEACFAYLNMLRAALPASNGWVYEEVRAVAAMGFRFKAKEDPSSYTSGLAGRMQLVAPEHTVSSSRLFYESDPAAIAAMLAHMVPDRCVLLVASQQAFAGKTESTEKWYGTDYTRAPIAPELLAAWAAAAPVEALRLPDRNDLISTDFALQVPHAAAAAAAAGGGGGAPPPAAVLPTLLCDTASQRLWYAPEVSFGKPKLSVMLLLATPVAYESVESAVLTDLFVRHVKEALQEYSYMAEMASMSYVMQPTVQGIEVYVTGFSQKLPLLLQNVLQATLANAVDDEIFARVKDKLSRKLANFRKEQPYQHAIYSNTYALSSCRWHNEAKIEVVGALTADDLRRFQDRLLGRLFVEALVHGNVTPDGARALAKTIDGALGSPPPVVGPQLRDPRCVALATPSSTIIAAPEPNPDDPNSAVEVLLQVGVQGSTIESMKLELLAHIMREPCFDQLRTKEQLGYLVWSGTHELQNAEGLRFIVQSDKHDAAYLDGRVEAMLGAPQEGVEQTYMCTLLAEMSAEQFADNVAAVIAKKLEKDKTPWQQTLRFWNEVTDMTYQFDRAEVEAEALKEISQAEIVAFFETHVAVGAPKRSRFCTQIFGGGVAVPPPPPTPEGAQTVVMVGGEPSDLDAFKRNAPYFPARPHFAASAKI